MKSDRMLIVTVSNKPQFDSELGMCAITVISINSSLCYGNSVVRSIQDVVFFSVKLLEMKIIVLNCIIFSMDQHHLQHICTVLWLKNNTYKDSTY